MISGFSTIAAAVVILLCITDQCTAQNTNCSALATDGDCNFYDCLSTKFRCDGKDYPLRRGKPDCQKYMSESSCFTKSGQAWLSRVRRCLMQAIVSSSLYNNESATCDDLAKFAIGSRPKCYIDNGFCTSIFLSLQCQNLNCIQNRIYPGRRSWSRQSRAQIIETTESCPSQISTFLTDAPQQCNLDSPDSALPAVIHDHLDCTAKAFDFMILLDASGSVGADNFEIMKNFVANMLSNFTIGPGDTRVGVISFASSPSIVIPLGSINTYSQLATAVRGISYTQGGTNTAGALDLLSTAFATARVSEGIPRVAAVFTDGMSNDAAATIQSAQAIHNDKINVFSFGIGTGVSNTELIAI
uniref:VWFA domain-containing protein n=1 Tax=Amphimedon queenslandica TaxID=400682 RepID=A0A1X7T8B1_AMPQE